MSRRIIRFSHGVMLLLALATMAHALEDPTRPPGYGPTQVTSPAPAQPRWRLVSTLIAPARRVANINGQLVRQGETINGARVVEIQTAQVVLLHRGKRIQLSLLPPEFKHSRGAR